MQSAVKTGMSYGDKNAMVVQAAGLMTAHMTRNTTLNRLTGPMPKGTAGAIATIRKQTSNHYPIVKVQDLGKATGDEVEFHLVNPVGAKPIMGSRMAEGRGVGMRLSEDKLRVDQARFPVDLGDTMSRIRTPYDMRTLGRPVAQSLVDRYVDQSLIVHMAGARGFQDNIEWVIPLESDLDYKAIMVNVVRAPTKNRHFMAKAGAGITQFAANAGEMAITTADLLTMNCIDGIRTTMEQMILPPPPVIFEGDKLAADSPVRVLLVSPAQYSAFATDPTFRQFQASAMARASQAGQHPLFMGDAGLWNGILIVKLNRPIRFYAGDVVKYCASVDSEVESTCTVPAGFGTTFAVDRAILLGGQAIAEAWAASGHSGFPIFWKEKLLDHDDKVEILAGLIRGVSKIRYEIDHGGQKQWTDYGVTVIDTAAPIIGPRL